MDHKIKWAIAMEPIGGLDLGQINGPVEIFLNGIVLEAGNYVVQIAADVLGEQLHLALSNMHIREPGKAQQRRRVQRFGFDLGIGADDPQLIV